MSDRDDLTTGLGTMTDAFITSYPTLLRRRFDERPDSLVTDLPCAFFDLTAPGTIHYDSGLRDHVIPASIVFVNTQTTNQQVTAWRDSLIDAWVEHMDSYPHIVGNTWWSDAQWTDESIELSEGVPAAAVRVAFEVHFLVGRP